VNANLQRKENIALFLVGQSARHDAGIGSCNDVSGKARIIKHSGPMNVLADIAIRKWPSL
jgi:hypothetical protein